MASGDPGATPRDDLIGTTFEQRLALKAQQDEVDLRRRDIRAGIWKILLGTSIVGLAAALFPAVQEGARFYFEYLTEQRRLELDSGRAEQIEKIENRAFLESLAKEGRSENLDKRITLAEFYIYLSDDETDQERWKAYYDYLVGLRDEKRDAVIEAARASVDPEASAAEIVTAQAKARLFSESAAGSETAPGPTQEQALPPSFEELLDRLESGEATVRRGARTELSALGLSLVRPAMQVLGAPDGQSYRTELGLVVALTEMMRRNKGQRLAIASLLESEDLERLALAAAHDDRTLRIHAGEFLYDLGDPRVFDLAPALWEDISSDNGRFNLALAMKGAAPHVAPADRDRVQAIIEERLGVVGPQTDQLLLDAIGLLPG